MYSQGIKKSKTSNKKISKEQFRKSDQNKEIEIDNKTGDLDDEVVPKMSKMG